MLPRILTFTFLIAVCLLQCSRPYVYRNHPDFLSQKEAAWILKSGYIFWIPGREDLAAYSLVLTPGEYMIEYREAKSGVKGAALCEVEAGVTYTIRITEKIFMRRAGRYVYNGVCEPTDEYNYREFPDSRE